MWTCSFRDFELGNSNLGSVNMDEFSYGATEEEEVVEEFVGSVRFAEYKSVTPQ